MLQVLKEGPGAGESKEGVTRQEPAAEMLQRVGNIHQSLESIIWHRAISRPGLFWAGIMGLSGTACLSAGDVLLVLGTATQHPLGARWLLASLHFKARLPMCILTRSTHSRFLGRARAFIPCCTQQPCVGAARG